MALRAALRRFSSKPVRASGVHELLNLEADQTFNEVYVHQASIICFHVNMG